LILSKNYFLPLTLEDLDCHSCLLILVGREDLAFLGWDEGAAWDNSAHDTSDCLDTYNLNENKL
jgi:hypothetical protein